LCSAVRTKKVQPNENICSILKKIFTFAPNFGVTIPLFG
jgi:hypothetical protein